MKIIVDAFYMLVFYQHIQTCQEKKKLSYWKVRLLKTASIGMEWSFFGGKTQKNKPSKESEGKVQSVGLLIGINLPDFTLTDISTKYESMWIFFLLHYCVGHDMPWYNK